MKKQDKLIKIYVLRDPHTHVIYYVGKTAEPLPKRLDQHVYAALRIDGRRASFKDKWIKELNAKGVEPKIEILETVTGDWQERERYWIAYYKKMGHSLTNGTMGGLGVRRG